MADDRETRKVAVILAADVAGYARLAESDEGGALARLKAHRMELIDPSIAKHYGRIVKAIDDGFLAEFSSVVDAVECAVDVQRRMSLRNADLPPDRRIDFRIGIDLGELIGKNDGLHGDGVSIAARLEGIAEPGGIVISGAAREPVRGMLPYALDDLGEIEIDTIPRPVRAFQVRLDAEVTPVRRTLGWRWPAVAAAAAVVLTAAGYAYWERPWEKREAPASVARMAYPLPAKPSVGVLAFDNLSGDPAQEALSDGLAENVIAALSKTNAIFVIARDSTFAYKGKPVTTQQVAEDLGIRYVVAGSVERGGAHPLVTVRLTDAITGRHIWAARYDHEALDVFAIGEEIVLGVAANIGAKLSPRQRDLIVRRETKSLDAWLLWREAEPLMRAQRLEDILAARQLLARALEIDPDFVGPTVALARTYATQARNFLRGNSRELYRAAEELLDKAMAIDGSRAETWAEMANYRVLRGDLDGGLAPAERAVALDPNNWGNLAALGLTLDRLNRHADAIRHLKLAWRLYPALAVDTVAALGRAYMFAGQADQAIATFDTIITKTARPADTFPFHAWLAVVYQERGDDQRARAQLKLAMDARPDLTISYFRRTYAYKDPTTTVARWAAAWRKLGMPE